MTWACMRRGRACALVVRQALAEPVVSEREAAEWNKRAVGRMYGRDAQVLMGMVAEMDMGDLKDKLAKGYIFPRTLWLAGF